MKILLLSTHLNIGGISRYLVELVGGLTQKGHTVFVATAGGKWESLLREKRGIHVLMDMQTKSELSPKIWKSVKKLNTFLSKERVDILHAHTRVSQVIASLLSRRQGIPYVTTCHGFYRRRLGRRLFPCWGEKVMAISETVQQHLMHDFQLKDGHIRLIPNGVDLDQFRPVNQEEKIRLRQQLRLPLKGEIIGSISRLVAVKGHDALLNCMASLKKNYPDASLVLVGGGEYRASLEALAKTLGISDVVVFTGEVESPLQYLSVFDVFVHPSQWDEGFGLALAEAMACGIPVVASKNKLGGMEMFIAHKENGYLLKGNDPYLLREAIEELFQNPKASKAMGEKGRQIIAEKFSIERVTEDVLRVYEEVVR